MSQLYLVLIGVIAKIWHFCFRIPPSYKLSRGEIQGHLSFRVDTDPANYLRQTGDYRCIAGSRNRYIASLPAKLRIAHLSDFAGTGEKPEVIEVYVGNDVIIGCKVPDSIPPPFVQVILVNYFDQNSNWKILLQIF